MNWVNLAQSVRCGRLLLKKVSEVNFEIQKFESILLRFLSKFSNRKILVIQGSCDQI